MTLTNFTVFTVQENIVASTYHVSCVVADRAEDGWIRLVIVRALFGAVKALESVFLRLRQPVVVQALVLRACQSAALHLMKNMMVMSFLHSSRSSLVS